MSAVWNLKRFLPARPRSGKFAKTESGPTCRCRTVVVVLHNYCLDRHGVEQDFKNSVSGGQSAVVPIIKALFCLARELQPELGEKTARGRLICHFSNLLLHPSAFNKAGWASRNPSLLLIVPPATFQPLTLYYYTSSTRNKYLNNTTHTPRTQIQINNSVEKNNKRDYSRLESRHYWGTTVACLSFVIIRPFREAANKRGTLLICFTVERGEHLLGNAAVGWSPSIFIASFLLVQVTDKPLMQVTDAFHWHSD